VVLEKIPARLASKITKALTIPTIGIGAGAGCDGQVLVVSDMLGLYEDFRPRFVRRYVRLADCIRESVGRYVKDVKEMKFPSREESY
jgi:3-methyl-2-oxobutanoate hydroxymethyltransferase